MKISDIVRGLYIYWEVLRCLDRMKLKVDFFGRAGGLMESSKNSNINYNSFNEQRKSEE